jgi:CrcB protein
MAAGGVGAACRFGVAGAVQKWVGHSHFPWGTATVNVLGCVLFGLIWTLGEEGIVLSPVTRTWVLTGFMGAFTTFSTYSFETNHLLQTSQYGLAAANLLGQNLLGILGIGLGMWLARFL